MVIWRWNAMGGVNLLEWTVNPFQSSNISKLQDFYWLSFEELYNEDIMKIKWVKKDDLNYIKENRDIEYAKKSTVWFELRDVQGDEKFKKLKDFYWFTLADTQDADKLIQLGLNSKDILYITWKDIDKLWDEEIEKWGVVKSVKSNDDITQIEQSGDIDDELDYTDDNVTEEDMREEYKFKFWKKAPHNMKLETLKAKLWTKN